jgi:hypothetical protein
MTQLRGKAAGLAALALATMVLAGCGGHKSTPNNAPAPASNNAPAAQTSNAPAASPSSGSGGYGY